MWSVVDFGKWAGKGKTLPQILVADPDWFFWAVEQNTFQKRGRLAQEAEMLSRRALTIKIPRDQAPRDCVRYWFTPDGKFAQIELIESSQAAHQGSSHEERRPHLNLSAPRYSKQYDKAGGALIIRGFKHYWFGDKSLTKARVEKFFSDPTNFLNP